jgi:proteasome lid subunit RPN8/RPN11
MLRHLMLIRLKESQLKRFRQKALDEENEILAYLVGSVDSPHRVTVRRFMYPELVDQSPTEVCAAEESWKAIREKAEAENLSVIGTIHSHPNWWPVQSQSDHTSQIKDGHRISGVCAVMSRRTKVYFWVVDSSLPCQTKYF